jgi:dolichol-phosphate mannosyltransferase
MLDEIMRITVILPTYNEAENLPGLVADIFSLPLDGLRVLVVDDNSPDGTGKVADGLASEYAGRLDVLHRTGKLGLGTAYILGFQHALASGAQAIAQMDADFSHPPQKLLELHEALQSCDIALGSRYVHGGSVDKHWPIWRKGLSAFGNFYARTILGLPIRDVTGGYRLYRRDTLLRMPFDRVRSNGYAFQVETAYIAHRLGFRFREVPIYFADRRWGQSKMSLNIQREAAIRVWQMLIEYRDLTSRSVLATPTKPRH